MKVLAASQDTRATPSAPGVDPVYLMQMMQELMNQRLQHEVEVLKQQGKETDADYGTPESREKVNGMIAVRDNQNHEPYGPTRDPPNGKVGEGGLGAGGEEGNARDEQDGKGKRCGRIRKGWQPNGRNAEAHGGVRKWSRLERRAASLIIQAVPETVRDEMIATNTVSCRLLVVYQPGGLGEKGVVPRALEEPVEAATIPEALKGLNVVNKAKHGRASFPTVPHRPKLAKALARPGPVVHVGYLSGPRVGPPDDLSGCEQQEVHAPRGERISLRC